MHTIVTEPVHQQLARVCRSRLVGGEFAAAQRFPSERDLAAEYGVSRDTANKVLAQMVSENLLVHRPGVGMFVAPPRSLQASLRQMESFTDYVRSQGQEPETRVLQFERQSGSQVPAAVRAALRLKPRDEVIFLERLRLANGEPVILEFRWLPGHLLPNLREHELKGSLYALLERLGFALEGEDHAVQARRLLAPEAQRLGVETGEAALAVEGPGFTANGSPIWYQVLLYRGDKYELHSCVRRHAAQHSNVLRRMPEATAAERPGGE